MRAGVLFFFYFLLLIIVFIVSHMEGNTMKNLNSFIALLVFVVLIASWMPARMVSSQSASPSESILAAGSWYVSPVGNDSNDCLAPATPCATINAAIGKANLGDNIYVATGTYTGNPSDYQVVLIDKSVTLTGGWNSDFTVEDGMSTIDGAGVHRCMDVTRDVIATVERFVIKNGSNAGAGGIYNFWGTLTLNNSAVIGNTADVGIGGGGIENFAGTTTLNNSIVSGNSGSGLSTDYDGTVILNNSTVSGNTGGGIYNKAKVILNNSTVSSNLGYFEAGIYNNGTLTMNNSTVSNNINRFGDGGGIYNNGSVTVRNSILAGNTAGGANPDCSGAIESAGYNLIGDTSGCTFVPGTGDLTNLNAHLGRLINSPGYHPLLTGSPAINAGNPAGCTDHLGNLLTTDQRGATRVGRCDMGAYEYTIPGSVASITAFNGTPQHAPPLNPFPFPLQVAVLDSIGSPVSSTVVTFTAPLSGASGVFADSGTNVTTVVSSEDGIATVETFIANSIRGAYEVTAKVSEVITPANFSLGNIAWYVTSTGNNGLDCQTPATACASINEALGKENCLAGDKIFVANGTYTGGSSGEVVLIDKDIALSGGWEATFNTQNGISTIDGEGSRVGIALGFGFTGDIEGFAIRNGNGSDAGGIVNSGGIMTLTNSTVSGNHSDGYAGGIYNQGGNLILNNSTVSDNTGWRGSGIHNHIGTLILNNSTVSGNHSGDFGGGIYNQGGNLILNNSTVSANTGSRGGGITNAGTLILNNSTISGNYSGDIGGGIDNTWGTLFLNNSTVSGNAGSGGGGIYTNDGTLTMRNSILAGNTAQNGLNYGPDCSGTINSAGYNIIGHTVDAGCLVNGDPTGNITDMDPLLGPLQDNGGPTHTQEILASSPAINAGNPVGCKDQMGSLLSTDQRGLPRFGRCDIGAYELQPLGFSDKTTSTDTASPGDPLTYTIELRNDGAVSLTNVWLTDTLPNTLDYIDSSIAASSGSFGFANGVITWTGSVEASEVENITFGAIANPIKLGTAITNSAVISGGGERFTRTATVNVPFANIFLPDISNNLCRDFFDDFSNPNSGWYTGEDNEGRIEYLNGEYSVLVKPEGYYWILGAPTCDRENYSVEVAARWSGNSGASYGLVFGIKGDFESFYSFEVNSDNQEYAFFHYDSSGWKWISKAVYPPAINPGSGVNYLKVTRSGDVIILEVNGTVLGYWHGETITGASGTGLIVSTYSDLANAEARFDNYIVTGFESAASASIAGFDSELSESQAPFDTYPQIYRQGRWR
jgi:uncharacterized repeat protein (TIGR01451 family)